MRSRIKCLRIQRMYLYKVTKYMKQQILLSEDAQCILKEMHGQIKCITERVNQVGVHRRLQLY